MKKIAFLVIGLAVSTAACSDDSSKSSTPVENNATANNGNTGNVSAAACHVRCELVAADCGASSAQGEAACTSVCAGGLPEANLTCLEGQSCAVLAAIFIDPDGSGVCGIGGTTGSGDCAGYPKCEGNSVAVCNVSGSTSSIETTSCGAMATCSAGKCEADACINTNATGCNSLNSPSGCCDDNATCFGNGNQQGETICCIPSGNACQSSDDCCNADNPTVPTICTGGACQLAL